MARTPVSLRLAPSPGATLSADESGCEVLTVGHSTRPIEVFIELLAGHGVTQLSDVRTVPRSRHNLQFNEAALPSSLTAANIGYTHALLVHGVNRLRDRQPEATADTQADAACPRSGRGNLVPVRQTVSGFAWRCRMFKAEEN